MATFKRERPHGNQITSTGTPTTTSSTPFALQLTVRATAKPLQPLDTLNLPVSIKQDTREHCSYLQSHFFFVYPLGKRARLNNPPKKQTRNSILSQILGPGIKNQTPSTADRPKLKHPYGKRNGNNKRPKSTNPTPNSHTKNHLSQLDKERPPQLLTGYGDATCPSDTSPSPLYH